MSGESSMGIQRTSTEYIVVYVFTESTGSTDIGESLSEYICPVSPLRRTPSRFLISVSPLWNIIKTLIMVHEIKILHVTNFSELRTSH